MGCGVARLGVAGMNWPNRSGETPSMTIRTTTNPLRVCLTACLDTSLCSRRLTNFTDGPSSPGAIWVRNKAGRRVVSTYPAALTNVACVGGNDGWQ